MIGMVIVNETRGTTLAQQVSIADSWFARLKGLLGREKFCRGEGMVLEPCNSVHTCFMNFPIDVVLLDHDDRVVGIYEFMYPYQFTNIHREAKRVIELPAGVVTETRTNFGDKITLNEK